jgi:hypothetical protein
VHTTGSRLWLMVSTDGRRLVSHAGSRLADPAGATVLTQAVSDACTSCVRAAPAVTPVESRTTSQ